MWAPQSFSTSAPGGGRLLAVDVEELGRVAKVRASGELDLFTNPTLERAVALVWAGEPATLTVDLAGVTFLSASAAAVILRARREAETRGVAFDTVRPPGVPGYVLSFVDGRATPFS